MRRRVSPNGLAQRDPSRTEPSAVGGLFHFCRAWPGVIAMRFAVISDIHGNIHALEAVLRDWQKSSPDFAVCAGDLVGYGAHPNEVIDLIRRERIPAVMGNYDDGAGFDKPECGCAYTDPQMAGMGNRSLQWTKDHVPAENKVFLRGLLGRLGFCVYGRKMAVVHGSPRRMNEYLTADRPEDSVRRLLDAEGLDVLVCGHTHVPYVRLIGDRRLINAGSVGKPKDGDPRAGYVLVTVTEDAVEAEIRRVAYNVEAAAGAVESSGLPREFASMLRQGKS